MPALPSNFGPATPNQATPYSSAFNVVGAALQLGYPNQGDPGYAVAPLNLRAVSWPEGRRIDLKWTNPSNTTRVVIKRSRSAHSAFINDDTEVIYNGGVITHFIDGVPVAQTIGAPDRQQAPAVSDAGVPNTNTALLEDQFYYYTVYLTTASDPIGILDFGPDARSQGQVTGLSLIDYVNTVTDVEGKTIAHRGEWFYNKYQTQKTRDLDLKRAADSGLDRGWFQNICRFLQGCVSLQRGLVRGLEVSGDPDACSPGNVGAAVAQAEYLVNWVRSYGLRAPRSVLDVSILRRIASSWAVLRQIKGRCDSLEDWTKVLTRWDATCERVGEDRSLFLKTWDSEKVEFFSYPSSLLTISAGQVYISPGGLEVSKYAGGLFVGPMRDAFAIDDNTEDVVLFDDTTAGVRAEDLLTVTGVVALGGAAYRLSVTRTAGGLSTLNDAEYDGMQLVDSNGVLMDVTATDGGSPSSVDVDSPLGVPAVGASAVAPAYIVPGAFASRVPQFEFQLWTRDPTFIYDPLLDLNLYGADEDPHHYTFNAGSLFGLPFKLYDYTLTIASGVAHAVGSVGTVVGNVLTDPTANFGPASSLKYYYLNPNRNQTAQFRVVDNTSTSITVEPLSGINLEHVSQPGTRYFLLDFEGAKRLDLLREHLPAVIPHPSRVFIFFE